MVAWDLKKLNRIRRAVQFKLGEWTFPLLEPLYRLVESRNSMVKRYFDLALTHLEQRRTGMALLNLNMTLSLKPNHFLARVYRGRVFVLEGRTLLASEDYIKAHMINRFRFLHYGLYREYFKSMKKETLDPGLTEVWDFNQVFEALRQTHDHISREASKVKGRNTAGHTPSRSLWEDDDSLLDIEVLSDEEQYKFEAMGPITQDEVEVTDWDLLIRQLSS
ncbi:MAG: hypothetical protein JSU88_05450 [Nitrospinaceae bacterium]|nr:MAG: hypothetical protein JSU88_05450 [Nitrospinaceae bacterium]